MLSSERRQQVESELRRAEQARTEQNEGLARVCARRAAGQALAALAELRGSLKPGSSAFNHLRALAADPAAPGDLRQAAARLTARVTPKHALPSPEDPLADARRIVDYVLGLA